METEEKFVIELTAQIAHANISGDKSKQIVDFINTAIEREQYNTSELGYIPIELVTAIENLINI